MSQDMVVRENKYDDSLGSEHVDKEYGSSESSEDEPPRKFEARNHYMLMPARKRQLEEEAALRKVERKKRRLMRAIAKKEGSLGKLNNDCLLEVLYRCKLQPSFYNLIKASRQCHWFWKNKRRMVLIGMQEERYPEYIEMLGRIGQQSPEHFRRLGNLKSTRIWKGWYYDFHQDYHLKTPLDTPDAPGSQILFLMDLEIINDGVCRQIQILHKSGGVDSLALHETKRALLVLWRLNWDKQYLKPEGSDTSDIRWIIRLDSAKVQSLLSEQPQAVIVCIKKILQHLQKELINWKRIMHDFGKAWIDEQERRRSTGCVKPDASSYQLHLWLGRTIRSLLTARLVATGFDKAAKRLRFEDGPLRWFPGLEEICKSRSESDRTGIEGPDLIDLQEYVKINRNLGYRRLA